MRTSRFLTAALCSVSLAAFSPTIALACEGDDDTAQAQPAKPKAGESVATIKVDGVHCGGCAQHIKQALTAIGGVTDVTVEIKTGTVRVVFNPKKTDEKALRAALKKAGYPEKVA
jgi:copper chaperone CopZ